MKEHENPCEQEDGTDHDGVHGADGNLMSEEGQIAVDRSADPADHLFGEPDAPHLSKHAAEHVVAHEGRAVGAGQKAQHLLKPSPEIRNGHIGAADKAVSRADDGSDGGSLTVRIQEEMNTGGERRAEQRQHQHVERHADDVEKRQIPTLHGKIDEAQRQGGEGHDEGARRRRGKIGKRQRGTLDGRNREVANRSARLVPDHQQVGAKSDGHAAYREEGGDELPRNGSVDETLFDREPVGQGGKKAVLVNLRQKGGVEHQQNDGRDQGGKEHPFILEKHAQVAPRQLKKRIHFSFPPDNCFPVTARNTSSILPLTIS